VRSSPTILHADLDAFYASVEQLLDPALRGRPIAVGGGVVLAASYEARKFGVRGGMAGWRAKKLCPDLQFVGGHFSEYQRLGDQVMEVLRDVTPFIERISIDEAFLDVRGAVRLFGPADTIAVSIRRRVREEIGLPISVGAARTKHLAKVASQVAKPDGLVVVDPAAEREFLDPLPIALMWGIGPVTEQKLHERGVFTIGQLAAESEDHLRHLLGPAAGTKLRDLAANRDERNVRTEHRAGSIGSQSAFGRKEVTPQLVRGVLGHLADRVARRMRAAQRAGRTVTVRIRFAGMRSITRSITMAGPLAATLTLAEVAEELAWNGLADHPNEREISLLAISVSNLVSQPALQLEFAMDVDDPRHPGSPAGAARWAVDQAMDRVRTKYGKAAVGYVSIAMSEYGSVPDEFRELAEHEL